MALYRITWTLTGSSTVWADTPDEAQAKFDRLGLIETVEGSDKDGFAQDGIFVETEPGVFRAVEG